MKWTAAILLTVSVILSCASQNTLVFASESVWENTTGAAASSAKKEEPGQTVAVADTDPAEEDTSKEAFFAEEETEQTEQTAEPDDVLVAGTEGIASAETGAAQADDESVAVASVSEGENAAITPVSDGEGTVITAVTGNVPVTADSTGNEGNSETTGLSGNDGQNENGTQEEATAEKSDTLGDAAQKSNADLPDTSDSAAGSETSGSADTDDNRDTNAAIYADMTERLDTELGADSSTSTDTESDSEDSEASGKDPDNSKNTTGTADITGSTEVNTDSTENTDNTANIDDTENSTDNNAEDADDDDDNETVNETVTGADDSNLSEADLLALDRLHRLIDELETNIQMSAADEETEGGSRLGAGASLDITDTDYVTGGSIEYKPKGSGSESWTNAANASSIPVDADFRITVNFSDIPVADLINQYGGKVTYTIPSLFQNASITSGSVIDPDTKNEIGTISIETDDATGTQRMTITYDNDFLQSHHEGKIVPSSMACEATADRTRITWPSTKVTIGPATIDLSFEIDPDSRLGDLSVTKTELSFEQDADGYGYLNYSITVRTGDVAMSSVRVEDSFTANSQYVDSYVAGSFTDANDIQVNDSGDNSVTVNGSNPGTMTWTVGDMAANTSKTLKYKVKLKNTYVGTNNTGGITNTAVPYSNNNKHASGSSTFTPFASVTGSKSAGNIVDNGSSITIPYSIFISAATGNTWTMRNVKVNDSISNFASGSRTDAAELIKYVKYKDFHLYVGGATETDAHGSELTIDTAKGRGTGTNPYCYYSDTRYDPRFDLYIGDIPKGETRVVTYNVIVDKALFGTKNGSWKLRNSTAFYTDDSDSIGNNGNKVLAQGMNTTSELGEKVWDRKLAGVRQETAVTQAADSDVFVYENGSWRRDANADKTANIPAGSYLYQVVVNEAGDWNVSQASMTDTLSTYLKYAGLLRIDFYQGGTGATASDDQAAVTALNSKTPDQTWWLDINDLTSFSVSANDLDNSIRDTAGAYLLTYYATPTGLDSLSQASVNNSFTLSGTVIGVGEGSPTITLDGIQVRQTMTVTGQTVFNAAKYGWYYNSVDSIAYWVIEASGTGVPAGTVFRDTPKAPQNQYGSNFGGFSQTGISSVVGVYKGTLSGNGHLHENFGTVSEFNSFLQALNTGSTSSGAGNLTNISSGSYTVDGNDITINNAISLDQSAGEKLYIIVTTKRNGSASNRRQWVVLKNGLSVKEGTLDYYEDKDEASLYTISGGTNFKEAQIAAKRDAAGVWSVTSGNSNTFNNNNYWIRSAITAPGHYTEWRIKVNYAGDEAGTVHVTDQLPEGMEPVYVRYFYIWLDSSGQPAVEPPTMPELNLGDGWRDIGLTNTPMVNGTEPSNHKDAHAYYNPTTRQIRFDVANLKNPTRTPGANVVGELDHYSLELQIITRVTDTAALTGTSKSFTNTVDIRDEAGELLTHDTATHTIRDNDITKTKPNSADQGRVKFTITANPLGEDLLAGADTLTLIDEMGTDLRFDPDSVTAVDKDGNNVLNEITVQDGGTTNGVKRTIFIIPDSKKIVLTYDGIVTAGMNETYQVSNKAYVQGYASSPADSGTATWTNSMSATSGAASNPTIIIYKRDADNNAAKLAGADFEVQQVVWNDTTYAWETVGTAVTGTTASGSYTTAGTTVNDICAVFATGLSFNQVYRITETKAPDGYLLDSTPAYICIANTQATPAQTAAWASHGVTVQVYGQSSSIFTYNAYDQAEQAQIMVSKIFRNTSGQVVSGTAIPNGTYSFGLYQKDGSTGTETLLNILRTTYTSGTPSYRLVRYSGGSTAGTTEALTSPTFAKLTVGATYVVYELDASNNPIRTSGTVVRLNGTSFQVQYEGSNSVTTAAGSTATVTIGNNMRPEVSPDTMGPRDTNGIYSAIMLACLATAATFALISMYRRRNKAGDEG